MNQDNIKNEILGKIKSGEIQMKSKAHFMLKIALLFFVIVAIFVISTFLISYILFSLRAGGQVALLSFGARGLYHFILALPWFLLSINIFLLIILDWLLKSFEFGYKSPIIYLFVGTLVVTTGVATLVNMTPFHGKMLMRSEQNHPPIPGFYSGIRRTHKEAGNFRGFVKTIDGDMFIIDYSPYDVGSSSATRVLAMPDSHIEDYLVVGDYVFVAGSIDGDVIRAYGIKKLVKNY